MAINKRFEIEEEEPEMNIAPLIDVAFLLLIYFLVTSTLQKQEQDLGLTLPSDNPDKTPFKLDPMVIKIDVQGNIYKNKDLLIPAPAEGAHGTGEQMKRLQDELATYKKMASATESKPIVIVAADDKSKQQRFVDVINTLAKEKITSVTLTGFRED
ncbi:MAG: biopolymer transporter ExbD [Verrucomicrobiales bacterium]